MITGRWAV